MSTNQEGIVIQNTGSHFVVLTDEGDSIPCIAKGAFRLRGSRTTNPITIGDRVTISTANTTDSTALITAIHRRKNYIIRRSTNLSKQSQIIAANLDQAILVVTLAHPTTSTTFVDRFLASAEAYNVPTILLINKIDLLTSDDDLQLLDAFAYLYRSIGYKVILSSSISGEGYDKIQESLKGKITLLSGNSGVGKSTLINRLIPGANLRTAPISDIHDTGMHTTTFSQMLRLPGNEGFVIDTPGVKGFGTIDFKHDEVSHYFPEIFKTSADCRYPNCTHTHEPGCAVKEALDQNLIASSRYNSYLSILEDTDPEIDKKYRKPY